METRERRAFGEEKPVGRAGGKLGGQGCVDTQWRERCKEGVVLSDEEEGRSSSCMWQC